MVEKRKLYRSPDDKVIAGVCGGIAEYFGVDPVFVRLIAVLLLIVGNGAALIAYLVMAVIVPERPAARSDDEGARFASVSAHAAVDHRTSEVARRAALIGGFVLIGVGLLFLAARILPGIAWWSVWPVIVIIVGIVQCITPGRDGWDVERFLDGLGTIAVGLILLGNVTGYISWRVWWLFVSLWPALLISIGLSIMGKGLAQTWLRVMGTLVLLATFAYAASMAWAGSGALPAPASWAVGNGVESYEFSEPATGVTSAKFTLDSPVGDIRMGAGSDLVAVSGRASFGEPVFSAKTSGDTADVKLTSPRRGTTVLAPGLAGPRMDIALGDSPVWEIDLTAGAASLSADLSEVPLSALTFSTGAGSANFRLGPIPVRERSVPVKIKSGVASVEVFVPEGVEARVTVDGGLTGTDVGDGFRKVGDVWQTPGYASTSSSYDIRIESGVGSVSVQTY